MIEISEDEYKALTNCMYSCVNGHYSVYAREVFKEMRLWASVNPKVADVFERWIFTFDSHRAANYERGMKALNLRGNDDL